MQKQESKIVKNKIIGAKNASACLQELKENSDCWQAIFFGCLLSIGNWASSRCSLTWKVKDAARNRHYPKLQATNNPVAMLPTVVAVDSSRSGELVIGRRKVRDGGMRFSANLCDLAKSGLLPTPTTGANRNSRNAVQKIGKAHQNHGVAVGLAQAIELSLGMLPKEFKSWSQVPYMYRLLPTPTAREHKGGRHPDNLEKAGRASTNSLGDAINSIAGKCCKLNPLFIAEMMGYPVGWTLQPFMDKKGNRYEN